MSHTDTMAAVFAVDPPKPPPRSPATVRDDWTPPCEICPICENEKELVAYLDGDGWHLTLDCPEECVDPADVLWPWVEDYVLQSDVKALGFEVVP